MYLFIVTYFRDWESTERLIVATDLDEAKRIDEAKGNPFGAVRHDFGLAESDGSKHWSIPIDVSVPGIVNEMYHDG